MMVLILAFYFFWPFAPVSQYITSFSISLHVLSCVMPVCCFVFLKYAFPDYRVQEISTSADLLL